MQTLPASITHEMLERLTQANHRFAAAYPGEPADRQPVHTVYGGAHLFKADIAQRLGAAAVKTLEEYAPDSATFARAIGLSGNAEAIYQRVKEKLGREPVEDFRIDFEDGYGNRTNEEEDGHAAAAAAEVARGHAAGTLPPFVGIRISRSRTGCTRAASGR
jgi:hypothetical protein